MPDSSYTRANFGGLDAGASNFQAAQATLRGELDDLESSLQAKLSEWDGDARSMYAKCKSDWDNAALDMAHVIQKLGLAINTANENYQAAEKFGVSIWS